MSASQLLQTAYDLERAAEIVEEGWCQGTLADHKGNHCLVGALIAAANNSGRSYVPPREALMTHLLLRSLDEPLPTWNDACDRTKAEVVCACLDCAAELRRRAKHG